MLRQERKETGLTFRELMSGPFTMGVTDPEEGASIGERTEWRMVLRATVTIADAGAFLSDPRPPATLTGEVRLPGVRRHIPFDNGVFRLFPPAGRAYRTLMVYEFGFSDNGVRYHVAGYKATSENPMPAKLWADTTTLATRLYRGQDTSGEVVGAGVLRLSALELARLIASLRTPRARDVVDAAKAAGGYALLFTRSLADTYLPLSIMERGRS
ncbi:hypothetical protein BAY61_04910 [Prauserella marina]|uniref:Cholesterol oxidase n=1 Tax=Prauserella marina TaxID=530584 RepID=A0A222VKI0_9PSEU|nr:hypothetical protein [Prauserella marina]ASR34439.1 hypothetical protein BAY61_04910 [Prauserella marina]PWV70997.1 hypothetical protein DES30_11351 [Prauserella marina]SDD99906.1 cholesterol oxidase [Prauserella marina]